MPSSLNVIKAGEGKAAVQSWQPGRLGFEPEYPGGGQPPFVPGTAPLPLLEEAPELPSFEPLFKPSGIETPPGWQPLDFKRLEPEAAPLSSASEPHPGAAGVRVEYRSWQPAELDLTPPEPPQEEKEEVEIQPSQPVDDGRELLEAARAQAEEMLEAAQARAAAILAEAEARAAEILGGAEAQVEAMSRQGYNDGMAAANAETAELLQTAKSIVAEVNTWRAEMFAQGELMMLRLVIEIAQTLFGDGLPLDPETLGAAFSRALSQAKTLGDLRIYVHPDDAEALGPQWAKQQSAISGQKIELVPSDIIKRGGCFIEGDYGTVDSRVESQFKLVQDALLASQAASQAALHAVEPPPQAAELEAAASPVAEPVDEMQADEMPVNDMQVDAMQVDAAQVNESLAGGPGPALKEQA